MRLKITLWIIGIVLVFTFVGIFLSDEEPTITSNVVKEDNSVELTEELIEENTITSNVIKEEISGEDTLIELEEEKCDWGYSDEYQCDGNVIQRKWISSDCSFDWLSNYHCLYGCENGECIGSCSDTDGGKDYYTKGYIDYGDDGKWEDKCYTWDDNLLEEYYCDASGNSNLETFRCPYGCSEGRCVEEPLQEEQSNYFTVTRVIDGDTIELSSGERVRLICIDTPETYEEGYQEAKNYLTNLILNKEVYLEKDISETDRYGRLLRYIYTKKDCTDLANCFINLRIVLQGYGRAYPYSPDTTLCPQIQTAESMARENKLGIWAETIEEPVEESSSGSNIICSYNAYNCGDFSSCSQVMEVFNACSYDIHYLDGDDDGIPCESLCG